LSPTPLSFSVNGFAYSVNFTSSDYSSLPFTGVGSNGTVNSYPTTLSYECPEGYYCPSQSGEPTPCPAGTYNPNNGSSALAACINCSSGYFNPYTGQSTCQICGSSSSSSEGSLSCTCIGAHRVFNAGNKQCICESFYEFRDGQSTQSGSVDGTQDCSRVVYSFCPEGSYLNEHGDCLTTAEWLTYCTGLCVNGLADDTNPFDSALGRCLCKTDALDSICDSACRDLEQSRQTIICNDPPVYVIRDDTGAIVFSQNTSDFGLPDIGLSSCPVFDGRVVSVYLMESSTSGFAGTYSVTSDYLSSVGIINSTTLSRRSFASDFEIVTNARFRRATSSATQILNPNVCLELNQVIMFSVSANNYPEFERNNLFNYQEVYLLFSVFLTLVFLPHFIDLLAFFSLSMTLFSAKKNSQIADMQPTFETTLKLTYYKI
jgi:hypothetical protein